LITTLAIAGAAVVSAYYLPGPVIALIRAAADVVGGTA